MTEEHRAIQLQQIANIVIDAYLNRNKRFVPQFNGRRGFMFLRRPKDHHDHPDLVIGHWYSPSDYDSEDRS